MFTIVSTLTNSNRTVLAIKSVASRVVHGHDRYSGSMTAGNSCSWRLAFSSTGPQCAIHVVGELAKVDCGVVLTRAEQNDGLPLEATPRKP